MFDLVDKIRSIVRYNYFLYVAVPILSAISLWTSYQVRFDFLLPTSYAERLFTILPYVVLVKTALFYILGLHVSNWRYVGLRDFVWINVYAVTGAVSLYIMRFIEVYLSVPRGVLLVDAALTVVLFGSAMISARLVRESLIPVIANGNGKQKKATVILGAGDAGEMLLREIRRNPKSSHQVKAFFDDNPRKRGMSIHGVRVEGPIHALPDYIEKTSVHTVLVAIPSAVGAQMRRINAILGNLDVRVKTLPSLLELMGGAPVLTQLRDIDITDILGREEIRSDQIRLRELISGKVVLVTGAGGSIGSEICRQVLKSGPARLLLLDKSENGLFHAYRKLADHKFGGAEECLTPVLCDIREADRTRRILMRYRPNLVLHAAAHKHVAMQEDNPYECFVNNVGGMRSITRACHETGVDRFILISTDKAVNPTSVMGATKRVCELYCQAYGKISSTRFIAVRFGNVLASEGSVVPIFMDQIASGGPVTVTHPEVRRYFMTIPEAVTLVLHAAGLGESGRLLMLDMGKPMKILDLAQHLIALAGKSEDEIPIEFIGLRPGEKLFEELACVSDLCLETSHERIKIFDSPVPNPHETIRRIDLYLNDERLNREMIDIRVVLKDLVPEYRSAALRGTSDDYAPEPKPLGDPDAADGKVLCV